MEARLAADRTGIIALQAASEKKLDLPSADDERAKMDARLNEPPKTDDQNMTRLRKVLGV